MKSFNALINATFVCYALWYRQRKPAWLPVVSVEIKSLWLTTLVNRHDDWYSRYMSFLVLLWSLFRSAVGVWPVSLYHIHAGFLIQSKWLRVRFLLSPCQNLCLPSISLLIESAAALTERTWELVHVVVLLIERARKAQVLFSYLDVRISEHFFAFIKIDYWNAADQLRTSAFPNFRQSTSYTC